MRKTAQLITAASAVATLLGALTVSLPAAAAEPSVVEQGKQIAFDKAKGNCLACHQIEGGDLPGNIGPPLVSMKLRFPDKAKLRAQIADSTQANPNSIMPPFGRHQILTTDELDKVVEFVHSL
jgi:sulfur-oxidizing protein SoxX